MLKKLLQLAARSKAQMAVFAGAAALCCGLSGPAQALGFDQISQVYFFGDSLSDSGFNDLIFGASSPKAPTFVNSGGYTWAQYIARDVKGFTLPVYPSASAPNPQDLITNNTIFFGAGDPVVSGTLNGIDYAAAGSTTNSTGNGIAAPSLVQQIAFFLGTHSTPVDPNAVYFIWSGANDFLVLLSGPTPTQLQLLQTANTAATNIANQVALLSANGAKRIVVITLPNLGLTPLIVGMNNPTLSANLKTVTFTFNSMLNQKLGKVISQYGTKVLYIDSYDLLNNVISLTESGKPFVVSGQSFQFTNATNALCASALTCFSATNGHIFADPVHPTDMAHRALSLYVEEQILGWNA